VTALAGVKNRREAALKVLDDEKEYVRLLVARSLTTVLHDKAGFPTVIKLLNPESDPSIVDAIIEHVTEGKDDTKVPVMPDTDDAKAWARYRENLAGWWKEKGEKVDLKKVDFDGVGRAYMIACYYSYNGKQRGGKVIELDKDGKIIKHELELEQIAYPYFAAKARNDRILICDWQGAKVSERDLKTKKVIWETQANPNSRPVSAERLPNGNTLIVGQNSVIEVNREGKEPKEIYKRQQFSMDIVTAGKHRDGTYTILLQNGEVLRLSAELKETKKYSLGGYVGYSVGVKLHYLPNGGVVIPDYSRSKLREFDSTGKQVAEITASMPTSATKLSNGNYAYFSRSNNHLYEIKKDGSKVSEKNIMNIGKDGGNKSPLFADRR